jgi:ketosteroid isomerase-like protein
MTLRHLLALAVLGACAAAAGSGPASPRAVADELLDTDRAFATAAASTDGLTALSRMFDAEIILPVPGGRFVEGKSAAVEALRSSPATARSSFSWRPIRAGVSADGRHGFTFGYMEQRVPDSATVPIKYLAYWIKRPEGWRILTHRRRPRPNGPVSLAMMAPSLPEQVVPSTTDASTLVAHRTSLAAAERAFSDRAQVIGIGPAFEQFGSADAVNLGGPGDTAFVVGSVAIGRSVGAGYPAAGSPVTWAADHKVVVASSGDLGVTFGFIREKAPSSGQAGVYSFFTIWRRPGTSSPWRYIAE